MILMSAAGLACNSGACSSGSLLARTDWSDEDVSVEQRIKTRFDTSDLTGRRMASGAFNPILHHLLRGTLMDQSIVVYALTIALVLIAADNWRRRDRASKPERPTESSSLREDESGRRRRESETMKGVADERVKLQLPTRLRTNATLDRKEPVPERLPDSSSSPVSSVSNRNPAGSLDLPSLPSGYRNFRVLGSGGFGEVLYALRDDGTEVAIKRLRRSAADHGVREKWFRREARLLSELQSSSVPKLLDQNLNAPHPYFVMEYIDGKDLEHHVRTEGPFMDVRQVMNMATGTATALVEMHAKGFLHRDIKPGNVMITRQGRCKLIDLGISKDTSSDSSPSHATAGTLAFAAPETVTESGTGIAADLFSWGATLGYAITGLRPYGDASGAALLMKVARGEIDDKFLTQVLAFKGKEDPRWRAFAEVIAISVLPDPAMRNPTVLDLLNRP